MATSAHPSGRFLRARADRVLLFDAAGGRCAICGGALADDWHADHIVPWARTYRTNVFEMQALCAACNTRKGSTMPATSAAGRAGRFPWAEVLALARPGVRGAAEKIRERFLFGDATTSIVLPTRYGKSDLIRLVSMGLVEDGDACCCLVLNGNDFLRGQIVDADKWAAFYDRYAISPWRRYREVTRLEYRMTANGEALLSPTVQLVKQHLDHFVDWAEAMTRATGKRGLVWIDEAHNYSEKNTWGAVAARFREIGWHVVLLTATAWREDGVVIPGFAMEIIDEKDLAFRVPRRDPIERQLWLDSYVGIGRVVHLKADYEVTFADAWNESPSPLAKLSRVPFDVELSHVLEGEEWRGLRLSELAASDAEKVLPKIVRDPLVVREGARRLIDDLHRRRRFMPESQAIGYGGNDRDPDAPRNEHLEQIKDELLRLDASLAVKIASTANGREARTIIEQFVRRRSPVGDVLLVKQMAGQGLDCSRIKTVLDLSTVRTRSASIQRWTRAATPHGEVRHAAIITPDDVKGRTLFAAFVDFEGGEMKATDVELVESRLLGEIEDATKPFWVIEGVGNAAFQDHAGNESAAELQERTAIIFSRIPELNAFMTWPELANRLGDLEVVDRAPAPVVARGELGPDILDCRVRIGLAMKAVIDDRFARLGPIDHDERGDRYGEVARDAWVAVYRTVGVPVGWKLDQITDLALLRRIEEEAERRQPGERDAWAT